MVNLFNRGKAKLISGKNWFLKSSKVTKIVIVLVILVLVFGYSKTLGAKSTAPQYQTSQAERGTLVESVTASGNISSSDSVTISTQATGVVSEVYVSEGEQVTQGEKIADITLDQNGQQNQAQAYASYLSSLNSLKSSQDSQLSADASMWSAQQSLLQAQQNVDQMNSNLTNPQTNQPYTSLEQQTINSALTGAQKSFNAAQQKYLDSTYSVSAAQAGLTSSSISNQEASSTITAPVSGTITNLNLGPGVTIVSQSNSSTSNAASSQTVGNISVGQGIIQALVNLSEIDATSVSKGQKVTLTLDAYPNKTFTGEVVAVDTNGVVSSGVTNYPTTIALDSTDDKIYLNMAAEATIITKVEDDVLLVPTAAVQTNNGTSTVRVLKNGQVSEVNVEVGDSNDTQTVITSGLNDGDTVITGETTAQTAGASATTSPFSGSTGFGGATRGGGGGGGFGGGGTTVRRAQ